jgi:hypothetical protein
MDKDKHEYAKDFFLSRFALSPLVVAACILKRLSLVVTD